MSDSENPSKKLRASDDENEMVKTPTSENDKFQENNESKTQQDDDNAESSASAYDEAPASTSSSILPTKRNLHELIQKHNSELKKSASKLRKRKIIPSGSLLSAVCFPQEAHVQIAKKGVKNANDSKRNSLIQKRGDSVAGSSGAGASLPDTEPSSAIDDNSNEPVTEISIIEPDDVDAEQEEDLDETSCLNTIMYVRAKIVFSIHSQRVQTALLLLLLLDVFVIIAELIIGSHQTCHLEIEPEKCLIDPSGAHAIVNSSGFFAPTTCGVFGTAGLSHGLHTAEEVLLWVSRAILIVFTAEILLLLACLGRHFFTILYTIDAIIVIASLIFSFTLDVREERESALIIFLRLWRFARVLHGFGMTVHEVEHPESDSEKEEVEGEEEGDEKAVEGKNIMDDDDARKNSIQKLQYLDETQLCVEKLSGGGSGASTASKQKKKKALVVTAPHLAKKHRDELLSYCKQLETERKELKERIRSLEEAQKQ